MVAPKQGERNGRERGSTERAAKQRGGGLAGWATDL